MSSTPMAPPTDKVSDKKGSVRGISLRRVPPYPAGPVGNILCAFPSWVMTIQDPKAVRLDTSKRPALQAKNLSS